MSRKPYFVAFILVGMTLFLLSIVVLALGHDDAAFLLGETGAIEVGSAFGYFFCAFYMAFRGGPEFVVKRGYIILMIVLFGLRELDLDKAFTTMGIFKSRFYISPEVPLVEKLAGGLVILLLLWILYKLCRNHLGDFLNGLKRFSVEAVGSLIVLFLLVFAKGIDGLPRKLEAIGITLSQQASFNFGAVEEVLEFGIPVYLIITFHAWLHHLAEKGPDVPEVH